MEYKINLNDKIFLIKEDLIIIRKSYLKKIILIFLLLLFFSFLIFIRFYTIYHEYVNLTLFVMLGHYGNYITSLTMNELN